MFQFQNGAIKSEADLLKTQRQIRFQFQNGAIKRRKWSLIEILRSCFNSKMVRLKVGITGTASNSSQCFNSKMVRLKGINPRKISEGKRSFNSKMVRLKASQNG